MSPSYVAIAATIGALLVSGCAHGTTGIWNEVHRTSQQLDHISRQLDRIDRDLKATKR